MRKSVRAMMVPVVALLAAVPAFGQLGIEPKQVTSSAVCGTCHRDIYRMWRTSAHASAVESVVFLDALHDVDPAGTRLCLGCHAPLAETNADLALKQHATWEGVSCDACHSLVSVEPAPGGARKVFDPGPVKRGPIRDAISNGHEVAYSALHASALVCAGCHEFTNAAGVAIITTYSEWEASAAGRQGRSCQDCHMNLTRADVVDPQVKRLAVSQVNLHEMPGGHSPAQLNKAVFVIEGAVRHDDDLQVDVRLANRGAGHAVPTGMPGRRIVLAVGVRTSDGKTYCERRVYTKTFRDAAGGPIAREGAVFAPGVELASDTRLRPDEERLETFHFTVAPTATATVSVKLTYEHDPGGAPENRTSLTFFSQERAYPPP